MGSCLFYIFNHVKNGGLSRLKSHNFVIFPNNWTIFGTYMLVWTGNIIAEFHQKILSTCLKICKIRQGITFFAAPCTPLRPVPNYTGRWQRQMVVGPWIVAWRCAGRELNPRPLDHESNTLTSTTKPPYNYHFHAMHIIMWKCICETQYLDIGLASHTVIVLTSHAYSRKKKKCLNILLC